MRKNYVRGTDFGILDETRHFYFTSQWQDIEERLGSDPDSADAQQQYAWGLRYIDEIILRDCDTDGNGSLDERLYATQDANWNVVGICIETISQRYAYDPFGASEALSSLFEQRIDLLNWEVTFGGYMLDVRELQIVRLRWYHPASGTWISRDPLFSVSHDFYRYVNGAPTRYTDPLGLLPTTNSCKGLEIKRESYLRQVNSSFRPNPDCDVDCPNCTQISLYIDLGDPCAFSTGHSGVAVGNDYWDWGPATEVNTGLGGFLQPVAGIPWLDQQAQPNTQKPDYNAVGLPEVLAFVAQKYKGQETDIVLVQFCLPDDDAKKIRNFWEKVYKAKPNFNFACIGGTQCTALASQSIGAAMPDGGSTIDFGGLPPAPQVWFEIARTFQNKCGKNKGKFARIKVIHSTLWSRLRAAGGRPDNLTIE